MASGQRDRLLAHHGAGRVLAMNQVVGKENGLRWDTQDRVGLRSKVIAKDTSRASVLKLTRAHSTIGGHPGHLRNVPLSPRKSSSQYALEQRYLRSGIDAKSKAGESASPEKMREQLYDGISAHGEGRTAYLKARADTTLKHRYGRFPQTSNQAYGFGDPWLQ
eukprot:TRINITY_DN30949_c0_g1_i1.p1 TRINITY_DN30949_c0_g1~~TRINITY_DN30949_c0_g1_i1.p1  ORF type:complete len:175 (-),score=18.23 TRINITY_DN30949_c0_g1_i1:203-691(-)